MIRCEKCGHKLRDGQKICDICKTPVRYQDTEDIELEEQLAKSIAKIVENETADAEVYLRQIQNTLDKSDARQPQQRRAAENRDVLGVSQRSSSTRGTVSSARTSSSVSPGRGASGTQGKSNAVQSRNNASSQTRSNGAAQSRSGSLAQSRTSSGNKNAPSGTPKHNAGGRKKGHKGRIAVIVMSAILVVALLVGLAFYAVNMIFSKAQDNFAYYNNIGIEHVQKKEYSQAIPYLEKALTYEEAAGKVNLRFSLYDCYAAMGDTEKAISMLYNILNIDPYNLEAIVNLETYYEEAGVVDALKEMYEKYKDTEVSGAVAKYFVEAPQISVEGGSYTTDLEVMLSSDYAFDIYYTTDGSQPTINSRKYTGVIQIEEGTTVLQCIAVNDYNIESDVVSASYEIAYAAPGKATISPASGSYETEQLIVIGNIPAGGKAYYTIDNTVPSDKSTLYEGPFEMPTGNFILSVIVYDKNGLASEVVKRNYVLSIADKFNQEEAEAVLWDTMIYKNMVNEEHLSSEGEPVYLRLDCKRTIDGNSLWCFDIYVSTEQGDLKTNYQMGVDCDNGFVYTVYENNGVYKLDPVAY